MKAHALAVLLVAACFAACSAEGESRKLLGGVVIAKPEVVIAKPEIAVVAAPITLPEISLVAAPVEAIPVTTIDVGFPFIPDLIKEKLLKKKLIGIPVKVVTTPTPVVTPSPSPPAEESPSPSPPAEESPSPSPTPASPTVSGTPSEVSGP